jgi:hypothetical protein
MFGPYKLTHFPHILLGAFLCKYEPLLEKRFMMKLLKLVEAPSRPYSFTNSPVSLNLLVRFSV